MHDDVEVGLDTVDGENALEWFLENYSDFFPYEEPPVEDLKDGQWLHEFFEEIDEEERPHNYSKADLRDIIQAIVTCAAERDY